MTPEELEAALRDAGIPFTSIPDDATSEEADRLLAQHHALMKEPDTHPHG